MRKSAKKTARDGQMKKNPVKTALTPEDDIIMTVPTLAEFLRCHESTIYRLLKNKKIPAFKVGSDWRFVKADIIRWMQDLAVRPKS